MIETRCGLICAECEYQEQFSCKGCINTHGNPFHGKCPIAVCCEEKGLVHCGECADFPCPLLIQYANDPQHGDTPPGARIEMCRKWAENDLK